MGVESSSIPIFFQTFDRLKISIGVQKVLTYKFHEKTQMFERKIQGVDCGIRKFFRECREGVEKLWF